MTALQILKMLVEYSIDSSSNTNEIYSAIGLNQNVFYSKLYAKREASEKKVHSLIKLPNSICIISGDKGCGKTTISNNVINDLRDQYLTLKIDFKNEIDLDKKLLKNKNKSINNIDNNDTNKRKKDALVLLNKFIKNKLIQILYKENVNNFDIFLFLYNNEITADENIKLSQQIRDHLALSDWNGTVNQEILTALYNKDEIFSRLYRKYIKKISIGQLIICSLNYFAKNRMLILFDNFDSIDSLTDQTIIIHFLEKLQNQQNDYIKILTTIRILNPSLRHLLIDYDSFTTNHIVLDYFEFINKNLRKEIVSGQSDTNVRSEKITNLLNDLSEQQQYFSFKIINNRINFLIDNINDIKKLHPNISIRNLNNILNISRVILKKDKIKSSITSICNCDRRLTLIKLIEFLEFIEPKGLLKNPNSFRIESEFNVWLISMSKILDFDLLNFVDNFSLKDITRPSNVYLNYLIINFISNYTDYHGILKQHESRVKIGTVIDEIYKLIGDEVLIANAIKSLITNDNEPVGILESEEFRKVGKMKTTELRDLNIWVTPKARVLKSHSVFTFHFLLALLIKSGYSINGELITRKIDSNSDKAFDFIFHFLNEFGIRHLNNLHYIFNKLKMEYSNEVSLKEVETKYLLNFGIMNYSSANTQNSYLFKNIIISHINYIGYLDTDSTKMRYKMLLDKYETILKNFEQILKSLLQGKELNRNITLI